MPLRPVRRPRFEIWIPREIRGTSFYSGTTNQPLKYKKCNTQSFPVVCDSPSPGTSWRNRENPAPLRAHISATIGTETAATLVKVRPMQRCAFSELTQQTPKEISFQPRFAPSARKKSFGSGSPVFAVYKARSEQPFFVVWGPWTVPGLECKKSPGPYALFSLMKSPSKMQSTSAAFLCKCGGMNAPGSIRISIIDGPSA